MDPKLKLKPIELLDVGIDKLTKIPVPILNDNVISTYTVDNGIPSDTFTLNFNAYYSNQILLITLISSYDINLNFNYGDGSVETWSINSLGTIISHTFPSTVTYTISISGWLDKIQTLIISPSGTNGGVVSVNISNLKKLSYLNLSNNRLETISLDGLVYLNNIFLQDNYFPNDVIDDIYTDTDTFLTFNGNVNTTGINNGIPSIYSSSARNSLTSYKGWTLSYNT